MKKRIFTFSILSIFFLLNLQSTLYSQQGIDLASLEDSIKQILIDTEAPGAQVALFTPDSLIWNKSFGYSDVANEILVESSDFFRIGSITKNFVSTAVLQLVERGRVSLDDPISKYLEDVQITNKYEEESPILIKHLLEHTAGFDDMHMEEYAAYAEGWTLKEGIDFHPDNRYARWRPGVHSSYCNSGPPLAAYIIEKITGQTFEEYVTENIFLPLGMTHSSFVRTDEVVRRLSKGYGSDGKEEMPYWHISQRPAGSINSNSEEMSRFMRMLLNRGSLDSVQILSPSSLDRMERAETTLAGKTGVTQGYGLHNYTTNYKGMVYHGHNGGMMGFLAQASYHPESGYGFVILVNATNGAINQIARKLFAVLYEEVGTEYPVEAVTLDAADEKRMLGYYRSANSRNQMLRLPEAIAIITKVGKDDEGFFVRNQLENTKVRATPIGSNVLLLENERGNRTPMVFASSEGDLYAQQVNWMANLKKTNIIGAFAPLVLTGLTLLFGVLLALWSIVWLPLKGLGIFKNGRPILRWVPLSIAITTLAFGVFFIQANEGNILENLGELSIYSMGIFATSLLMPILMLWFVWERIRTRVEDEGRWFRRITIVAAILFVIGVYYLFYFDMIALRTWAY